MTFNSDREAFVWIWLPDETEPVVAGRLEAENGHVLFNYGRSYLERIDDQTPNNNLSQIKTCLKAANHFLLSQENALSLFEHLTETIEKHWDAVCEEAELSAVDKNLLWGRQFLNPYSIEK